MNIDPRKLGRVRNGDEAYPSVSRRTGEKRDPRNLPVRRSGLLVYFIDPVPATLVSSKLGGNVLEDGFDKLAERRGAFRLVAVFL